jgi:hypothetical protein
MMFASTTSDLIERLPNGNIKFRVHDVTIGASRDTGFGRSIPLDDAFQKYGRVEYVSQQATDPNKAILKTFTDNNAFAEAVFIAFFEHFPLRLSPDVLWITILQGLAIHVNERSEALRSKFVSHEGKLALTIIRPDIVLGSSSNDWEGMIGEFIDGIHGHVHENVHPLIDTSFSTSTSIDRACMNIAVMDALKSYFELRGMCGCGIPNIELTGTPEDWTRLRQQASLLRQFELDWWIDELDIVLSYFERAATGSASEEDLKFWRSVVYLTGESGILTDPITGWMQTFFPYTLEQKGKFRRNNTLGEWKRDQNQSEKPKHGRKLKGGKGWGERPIVGHATKLKHFPSGINQAPFLLENIVTGEQHHMLYAGGLTAVLQGNEDHAIQTGWAVIESQK